MAKQTPTQDRYMVHCEVESDEQMGRVVGTLTRMGFKNVGFELITDVLTYKTRAAKTIHGRSALDDAIAFAKEHPEFKALDLVNAFEGLGRSASQAYKMLGALVEAKKLTKLGYGDYGVLDAPVSGPMIGEKGNGNRFDVSNKELIWNHVKDRDRFSTTELRDLFKGENRKENSISPIIAFLVSEKRIKAAGRGVYDVLKTATAQRPLRSNGEDVTGAAHGS